MEKGRIEDYSFESTTPDPQHFIFSITCTAPQNGAASATGSAAREQPGAVNMIFVGSVFTKSSIALMAAPLSHWK